MLALGQWFIDKKTNQIFNQNDENQPLEISKQAVQLLVFLAENQHKLIDKHSLIKHLWPNKNQDANTQLQPSLQQSLQHLITAITQQLGSHVITITPDDYYLLQLSTFSYQYTPITISQMKQQLAEKQLVEHKNAQLRKQQNTSTSTKLAAQNQSSAPQTSTVKKVLLVTIVALMIAAFLAAS